MPEVLMNLHILLSALSWLCLILYVDSQFYPYMRAFQVPLAGPVLWHRPISHFNRPFQMTLGLQGFNSPTATAKSPTIDEEIISQRIGGGMFNSPTDEAHGDNSVVVEGDIVLNQEEYRRMRSISERHPFGRHIRKKRKTINEHGRLWENREVLIAINQQAGFGLYVRSTAKVIYGREKLRKKEKPDQTDRLTLRAALNELSAKTCLRFRSPTPMEAMMGRQFVLIENGNGCSSPIGKSMPKFHGQYRYQTLILSKGCRKRHIMVHEIGHVLGLIHEQSRPDRDAYVDIVWPNVNPTMIHNFEKFRADLIHYRGTPYDYLSIMHYGPRAFSGNGQPTMMAKDPNFQDVIGSTRELSQQDALAINRMYGCGNILIGKKKK